MNTLRLPVLLLAICLLTATSGEEQNLFPLIEACGSYLDQLVLPPARKTLTASLTQLPADITIGMLLEVRLRSGEDNVDFSLFSPRPTTISKHSRSFYPHMLKYKSSPKLTALIERDGGSSWSNLPNYAKYLITDPTAKKHVVRSFQEFDSSVGQPQPNIFIELEHQPITRTKKFKSKKKWIAHVEHEFKIVSDSLDILYPNDDNKALAQEVAKVIIAVPRGAKAHQMGFWTARTGERRTRVNVQIFEDRAKNCTRHAAATQRFLKRLDISETIRTSINAAFMDTCHLTGGISLAVDVTASGVVQRVGLEVFIAIHGPDQVASDLINKACEYGECDMNKRSGMHVWNTCDTATRDERVESGIVCSHKTDTLSGGHRVGIFRFPSHIKLTIDESGKWQPKGYVGIVSDQRRTRAFNRFSRQLIFRRQHQEHMERAKAQVAGMQCEGEEETVQISA